MEHIKHDFEFQTSNHQNIDLFKLSSNIPPNKINIITSSQKSYQLAFILSFVMPQTYIKPLYYSLRKVIFNGFLDSHVDKINKSFTR